MLITQKIKKTHKQTNILGEMCVSILKNYIGLLFCFWCKSTNQTAEHVLLSKHSIDIAYIDLNLNHEKKG